MVSTSLNTNTKLLIVAALALALTANISGVLLNGIRGQQTCREVESLKAPEYKISKDNLANIVKYKDTLINIFGNKPTVDTVTGKTLPRWRVEYNKSVRISTERVDRYAPHQCKLLFWDD